MENLKSDNTQDYDQKLQQNCTFMNTASVCEAQCGNLDSYFWLGVNQLVVYPLLYILMGVNNTKHEIYWYKHILWTVIYYLYFVRVQFKNGWKVENLPNGLHQVLTPPGIENVSFLLHKEKKD